MTDLDSLERLNRLRESGALSAEEYEREKARVLAGDGTTRWVFLGAVLVAVAIIAAAMSFTGWSQMPDTGPQVADTAPAVNPSAGPVPVDETPVPATSPAVTQVDPPVPAAASPDLTNADYYNEAKRNMMRSYPDQPAGIRTMLGDWAGANTLCRGSSNVATVEKWCPIRDALTERLDDLGMCYGRPTDRSAADSSWHACEDGGNP